MNNINLTAIAIIAIQKSRFNFYLLLN